MSPDPLVRARGLTKVFRRGGWSGGGAGVTAVDAVDLDIRPGETLGLVGESGSGKSTLGRLILNLTEASAGTVTFDGHPVQPASPARMRPLRRRMQIVFQDPYSSLPPRMTVRETLRDGLRAGGSTPAERMDGQVRELIHAVGLGPAHVDVHPHKLSGGQRQRVAIARALSVRPEFVVADEAVSALDVSIQAQILNLLLDLQRDLRLTYLFISHDLNVIRYLADRVAVMYRGRIVEQAPADRMFAAPAHPYTRMLLGARPAIGRGGAVASPAGDAGLAPAGGCRFFVRCPIRQDRCARGAPPLAPVAGDEHLAACFAVHPQHGGVPLPSEGERT